MSLGKVVVFLGGTSSEREVSLMSGTGVIRALESLGVDVTPFDPKTTSLSTLEAGQFDRAFIALHGKLGEDGTIQGVLNYLNLPYTGPGVLACAVAMNKELTKTVWRAAGIPVPRGVLLTPNASEKDLQGAIDDLGATGLVVKPSCDGSSIGVSKLNHPVSVASLRAAIETAASKGDSVLVEEYIHGREFTVAVIDGKALPVIEIKAPDGEYDFQNKYFGDAVKYECPAAISEAASAEILALCEQAYRALGCRGWSRIDLLARADGTFALLEINTSPGMTEHSLVPMAARAIGMDYPALCAEVLRLAKTDY